MKELQDYFKEKKEDFAVFKNHPNMVYLDSAATTQKPDSVIDAISNFYRESNANVHRSVYALAETATAGYEKARKTTAEFIDVAPEEIIFTRGTTESLNALAYSLILSGDYKSVIVPLFEHHSNFVPWQQLAKKQKIDFHPLPINNGSIDLNTVEKYIFMSKKPFIFSMTGITNTTGYRTPFEEVSRMVHEAGGIMVLDGAQLIPHESFDFKASGADFVAFSAHKLLGPMGTGVLSGKRESLEKMKPFMYGGEMIEKVMESDTTFAPLPYSMEAGTPNVAGAIGLGAAIDYLKEAGMAKLNEHITYLTDYATEKLKAIPGIRLFGPKERHGIIGFIHETIHSHDVAELLSRLKNVAIRSGHHCAQLQLKEFGIGSMSRVSFYLYNTKEDVDRLIEGIEEVKRWFE